MTGNLMNVPDSIHSTAEKLLTDKETFKYSKNSNQLLMNQSKEKTNIAKQSSE